jgi:integrase
MEMPIIPGASARLDTPLLIETKYNPIINPVTKYDCPPPTEEPPSESPLVDDKLADFLSWGRSDFRLKARIPITADRTYTQTVTVTECGFREIELEGLDAHGDDRDIDYDQGVIRTRFGKGSRGSGPRTRTIEMSRFARETIKYYEDCVLGHFPVANNCTALFRSQRGNRLGYWCARSALLVMVKEARRAGLILPNDMGWHSLRRSFAMRYLDRHPGQIWELLQIMGHGSYLSLVRYLRPSEERVNAALEKSFAWVAGRGAI